MNLTWVVEYGSCPELPAAGTPERAEITRLSQVAVEYLWNWTGRVYGQFEVTVQLERCPVDSMNSTFHGKGPLVGGASVWRPVLIAGLWYNVRCGSCPGTCMCGGGSVILDGPVVPESVRVSIDGVQLPQDAYRLKGSALYRVGGCWPLTGMEVTYTRGLEVPEGGKVAAGLLTCELLKALNGDPTCGLPQRVQSITRQGVTVAVLDAFEGLERGHTGIWAIDSWIESVNSPARRRGTVYSVDLPRR